MLFLEIGATQFVNTAIVVEVTNFSVMLTRKNTRLDLEDYNELRSHTSFADSR